MTNPSKDKPKQDYYPDILPAHPKDKRLIIPCDCGEQAYLDIQVWDDEYKLYTVGIVQSPSTFRARLKEAWQALRGNDWLVSGELLVGEKELKQIKEFFRDL